MFHDDVEVEIDPIERGFDKLGWVLGMAIILFTGGIGIIFIYFIGLED